MKNVLRLFLFLFFFLSTIIFLILLPLKSTIFSRDYLKNNYQQSDLYRVVRESTPQIAKTIIQKNTKTDLGPQQTLQIFSRALTTENVRDKLNRATDQFYDFLDTGKDPRIVIDLRDVRPRIQEETAKELNVPLEFVTAGAIGLEVPQELSVRLPEWFLLGYLLNISIVSIELILISIVMILVFGFAWLKGPRLSERIKSLSFVLNIFGLITLFITLLIKFTFGERNIMAKSLADYLEIPATDASALYNFFNKIINDFSALYLGIAAVLLVSGISLRLLSIVIKKREVKKFQEQEEKKHEPNNHKH